MLGALTLRGRCLFAAGLAAAVCSVVLDERDLLRVAAFVIALPVLAWVVCLRARVRLRVQRQITPGTVSVGESAEVVLQLRARTRLGGSCLLLEDKLPKSLGKHARFTVDKLRGTALARYSVTPTLRGLHAIGPLTAAVRDPFGLAEIDCELAKPTRLLVLPTVVPLTALPAGAGLSMGGSAEARLRAGHGSDDTTVRQYRHGDDIKRVHWKTTARRDELMVRAEERPWQGGITLLLDRRSAAHRGTGALSSMEWAVSAVASMYLQLHRNGQAVHVLTEDGTQLEDRHSAFATPLSAQFQPAERDQQVESVLEALATVRPSMQRDLVGRDRSSEKGDPSGGQELIAVLGAATTTGIAELARSRPPGSRSSAILLDPDGWHSGTAGTSPALIGAHARAQTTGGSSTGKQAAETAEHLRALGWRVVTVDRAMIEGSPLSLNTVWGELCR